MDKFIIVALFVAISLWRRKQPENNLNTNCNAANPPNRNECRPVANKPPNDGWHAQEKKHRRWEKRYWLFSSVLSIFITGGAIASATYAWNAVRAGRDAVGEAHQQAIQAKRQADIADEQLMAQIRPWISPSMIMDSLEITATGVSAHFRLTIRNTGHVPVFSPVSDPKMVITPQFNLHEVTRYFDPMCRSQTISRYSFSRYGGTSMPPDEQWVQHRNLDMVQDDSWLRIKPGGQSTFMIYGCLIYGFQGSPSDHQTRFIYEVGMKDPVDDASVAAVDFTHPRIIGGDELRVRREYYGNRSD